MFEPVPASGSTALQPLVIDTAALMPSTLQPPNPHSLRQWIHLYVQVHVVGAPAKTALAKRRDLDLFVRFIARAVGHDHVDGWTPAVSKQFQHELRSTVSARTQAPLEATTINRVMATVRHLARWLHKLRPLLAGDPMIGVKDIATDQPAWNGLTALQLMRLKSACEQRLSSCTRKNQNPLLESTVFHLLLHTGMRAHELSRLDLAQYHHRGLHGVKRKGARVSKKIPVPSEARDLLDRYVNEHRGHAAGALLLSRYGRRLSTRDIARICDRLAQQACVHAQKPDRFSLTPHMLRHTFLKRVADKHGVHVAQEMSGNISIREIFRYTKPSEGEVHRTAEELFE